MYWATLHVVSFSGAPRAESVRRMAHRSEMIGVVRVTRVEPFFVEDRSGCTRVAGTVDDPIKGASKTFEAHCDGGEMRINAVLVRAGSARCFDRERRSCFSLRKIDGSGTSLRSTTNSACEGQCGGASRHRCRALRRRDGPEGGRGSQNYVTGSVTSTTDMTQILGRALGAALSLTVAFASDAEAQKLRTLRQRPADQIKRNSARWRDGFLNPRTK